MADLALALARQIANRAERPPFVETAPQQDPHASGNVYGTYARRGEGPGSIDLSGVLNRADGRQVGRYLPIIVNAAQ